MTNTEAIEILKHLFFDAFSRLNIFDQEAFYMAIEALKAQNVPDTIVGDTISRQAAVDALCAVCGNDCDKSEFVYNAPQDEQVILCPEHYCLCMLPSAQSEVAKDTNVPINDTISRQAAIDAVNDAIVADEQPYAEDALRKLPSARPEPQWIPCSERLPEKIEKDYWVCLDEDHHNWQCVCKWKRYPTRRGDIWAWHLSAAHVVAWMPLPEPYKEYE